MYDHNKIYDDVFKTYLNVIRTKENNQRIIILINKMQNYYLLLKNINNIDDTVLSNYAYLVYYYSIFHIIVFMKHYMNGGYRFSMFKKRKRFHREIRDMDEITKLCDDLKITLQYINFQNNMQLLVELNNGINAFLKDFRNRNPQIRKGVILIKSFEDLWHQLQNDYGKLYMHQYYAHYQQVPVQILPKEINKQIATPNPIPYNLKKTQQGIIQTITYANKAKQIQPYPKVTKKFIPKLDDIQEGGNNKMIKKTRSLKSKKESRKSVISSKKCLQQQSTYYMM